MKLINNSAALGILAVAVCLSSCNKNGAVNVYNGQVRFTAGIGDQAVVNETKTRAAGTTWGSGDHIGIFMVKRGTTAVAEGASNKEYITADGTGNFTPVTGSEIYYPMDNSPVDFISYYPYRDNAGLGTLLPVEIDTLQTAGSQAGFDLLWAKADNSGSGYNKTSGSTVELSFGHCLSKLTMNCKADKSVGVNTLDGMKVMIKGMNTQNTLNLKTAALGTPAKPAKITPNKLPSAPADFLAVYDAIILPGNYTAGTVTVDFNIGGEIFTWDVGHIEFKEGHEYIYEVLITRTKVEVKGTIVGWSPVQKSSVTAE